MSLTHVTINCATEGCYAVITLHPQEEKRLRRTHETFYCPAGHSQWFPGKTEEEKRIEHLERMAARLRQSVDREYAAVEDLIGEAKACPIDGCSWRARRHTNHGHRAWALGAMLERIRGDLLEHLEAEHNLDLEAEKARLEAAKV